MVVLVKVEIRRQKASRKITFLLLNIYWLFIHVQPIEFIDIKKSQILYLITGNINREYILKNAKNDYDSCMHN